MSTEAPSKDFFISYNREDRQWAEWIAWVLEEAGYHVIIQAWDFRPGGNWVLDMNDGLENADRTILVLSPNSIASDYVKAEWTAVFVDDPIGANSTLVPVRIAECTPTRLLKPRGYLDLVGLTDEDEITKTLLDGLKPRGKPDTKPPCPVTAARAMPERPEFPVGAQAIHNIPHRRNPNFTGREKLLADLRKKLSSGKSAALTQAMHGLGGIGKTQTAVEYAYRYKNDYSIIWWVRCEDAPTLSSDYASLAAKVGLPGADAADEPAIVQAVRAYLSDITGWLLIFDNVNEPDDLDGYLPLEETGHVIVTSRNPNWRGKAEPLSVNKMKRSESIDLLLKRSGQTDRKGADALADSLWDFPLALAQAAAYMEEAEKPPAEYLKLYREHAPELLGRGKAADDYKATVATTWEISFQAVQDESEAGADLLNLCGFFAPDNIPLDVIAAGAEFLPEPLAEAVQDEFKLDDALRALRRYSLVECADGMLSVHRLVQEVTRDRLDGADRKKWAEAAVRTVGDAFPGESYDVRTWDECSSLLPHALGSAGHAEELGLAPEATGTLLNQVGLYLWGRSRSTEAKAVHERALRIGVLTLGPDHPVVATLMSNLGNVLQDLGDLSGARDHFRLALAITEKTLGADHPQVAICANNLGNVLRQVEDLQGAKDYFERALRIDQNALGHEHPTVALLVNNVGNVLLGLGDLQGARDHFERALAISEKAYGIDHPQVAGCLNNLGIVLRDLGDLQGAKEHYLRALSIEEKALGANHPHVAKCANNLGNVLRNLGDLQGARKQAQRALSVAENAFGMDHPDVATYACNLGLILHALGNLQAAKAHYERALGIFRRFLGDEHPSTKKVQENLDTVLREIEKKESGGGGDK